MATKTIDVPTGARPAGPCPCGRAPCAEPRCRLDSIVAPRFFCGQLLTDQDLTALVQWTRDKQRLARLRHGWGVACGLRVRCGGTPGVVVVDPGYAVSACGDDIVVSEPVTVDLGAACDERADPCSDLRAKPQAKGGVLLDTRRAVDLTIAYAEVGEQPQAALLRGGCDTVADCEDARLRETYKLAWRAISEPDATPDPVAEFQRRYDATLDVVRAFRLRPKSLDGNAVRDWLVGWIDAHGLHQLCGLRAEICAESAEALTDPRTDVRYLFLLVQDARAALLDGACSAHDGGSGVPLARVWLRANGTCDVLLIDPYEPYRRELRSDAWPAPLGSVNVGQVLWHRREEACRRLADLGVRLAGSKPWQLPENIGLLEDALDCSPFVACHDEPVLECWSGELVGERVVRVCPKATPPVGKAALEIIKRDEQGQVEPLSTVPFSFLVVNTGTVDLHVALSSTMGAGLAPLDVPAGGTSQRIQGSYKAARSRGTFTHMITAVGTSDGGQTASAQNARDIVVGPAPMPVVTAGLELFKRTEPNEVQQGLVVSFSFEVANTGAVDLHVTFSSSVGAPLSPIDVPAGRISLRVHSTYPTKHLVGMVTHVITAIGTSADGQTVVAPSTHHIFVVQSQGSALDTEPAPLQTARPREAAPPPPPPPHPPPPPPPPPPAPQPTTLDLTDISGIGPRRAAALEAAGITLQTLADRDPKEIAAALGTDQLRVSVIRDWQAQARRRTGG